MSSAQRTIRQARTMSKRTRLLIGLVTATVGLTAYVAVALADTQVFFVGDFYCQENVGPGSDQIDDGWSYNNAVDAGAFIANCNSIYENGAYIRAYANKSDGTWPCGNTGFAHVRCTVPSGGYPYTRAHCVNMSGSSSRWMQCSKYKL